MTEVAVRCSGIAKRYGETAAVREVDLELEKGSFLALLGHSGCGKTTLLRLIAGFETPDAGSIEIGGKIVSGPGIFVPPEKRRVGMVFQDYALFPHLDVAANIGYGLAKGKGARERVQAMLSLVGLKGLEWRMPHQLSGGEQQRVALARALAPGPEVLLLDEPLSNLDADLRARVRAELKEILTRYGASVIFVTHDQEEALFMGDLVGVMNSGQLEQVDTPEAIFHSPATPFVAQFVGSADFLLGRVEGKTISTELGRLPLDEELPQGTPVSVMVRPDVIDIKPELDGVGVIANRVFQGFHYLYQIRLSSGATVSSLQRHRQFYQVGAPVAVHLNPSRRLTCFVEGHGPLHIYTVDSGLMASPHLA